MARRSTPQSQGPRRRLHRYSTRDAGADAKIAQLLSSVQDEFDRRLLTEMASSVYRLGHERAATGDIKLLNASLKELRYAFKIFRPYRHIRKVATFGSARLTSGHAFYALARTFGRLMAQSGWMVMTGAASGIMKAGLEGAGAAASFGLNIRLPFEQGANEIIAQDQKLINCKYFFTRKLLFIKESQATALFPGGFGTLDEGFETLTLVQTGKSDPRPIVFVDLPEHKFWAPMLTFFDEQLIGQGMISKNDRALYEVANSAEDAAEKILSFYKVYHSIRYVGQSLVIRLQHALPEEAAAQLSMEFRDVLTDGDMQQRGPLSAEADEPDLKTLPRLVLHFNRRDYGRLIQLVHRINELGAANA